VKLGRIVRKRPHLRRFPRSVEKITSKLLMITEVKVGLGNRGLISVREGFLGHRRGCQ